MRASWRGSAELKARVLAALETHRASASLAAVEVDGRTFECFGWPVPASFAVMAELFAIPATVLALGWYRFDDLPENPASIHRLIESRSRFLSSIPVARDLESIPTELMWWLLTEPSAGLRGRIETPRSSTCSTRWRSPLPGSGARRQVALDAAAARRRNFARGREIAARAYRGLRAIEVALHCLAPSADPVAAIERLVTGTFPAGETPPSTAAIGVELLALLARA